VRQLRGGQDGEGGDPRSKHRLGDVTVTEEQIQSLADRAAEAQGAGWFEACGGRGVPNGGDRRDRHLPRARRAWVRHPSE
jgi:hypothetical protein